MQALFYLLQLIGEAPTRIFVIIRKSNAVYGGVCDGRPSLVFVCVGCDESCPPHILFVKHICHKFERFENSNAIVSVRSTR